MALPSPQADPELVIQSSLELFDPVVVEEVTITHILLGRLSLYALTLIGQ